MMTREEIAEFLEDALFADGFDSAIIGVVQIFNNSVVLYDTQKCIDILMERDGMSDIDAVEFFDFNVLGSYVGEKTPAFAFLKSYFN